MGRALRRSLCVALVSVAGSLLVTAIVLPMMGTRPSEIALVMCVAAPLLIAFPISFFSFRQKERMHEAHEELAEAHRQLADLHAELTEAARRDSLTGLLNRGAFLGRLESACAPGGTPGVLLMIDADNFKAINDRFGHLAGDEALISIAGAMERVVGSTATVGRIGGEEFAVILHETDGARAFEIADRLRAAVAGILLPAGGNRTIATTVSIGAAAFGAGADMVDIMRLADKRLYEAKNAGRNRPSFPRSRTSKPLPEAHSVVFGRIGTISCKSLRPWGLRK
jgi:diguanylate cyclase (GGDEF)-like protein